MKRDTQIVLLALGAAYLLSRKQNTPPPISSAEIVASPIGQNALQDIKTTYGQDVANVLATAPDAASAFAALGYGHTIGTKADYVDFSSSGDFPVFNQDSAAEIGNKIGMVQHGKMTGSMLSQDAMFTVALQRKNASVVVNKIENNYKSLLETLTERRGRLIKQASRSGVGSQLYNENYRRAAEIDDDIKNLKATRADVLQIVNGWVF